MPSNKGPAKFSKHSSVKKPPSTAQKQTGKRLTEPKAPTGSRRTDLLHSSTLLQQRLLNVFQHSFPGVFNDQLTALLQEVKSHLYRRDFDKAFGQDAYLAAYTVRWSPSRALGYFEIFSSILPYLSTVPDAPADHSDLLDESGVLLLGSPALQQLKQSQRITPMVCLGGGAGAEIVALGGLLNSLRSQDAKQPRITEDEPKVTGVDVLAVDSAPWSSVLAVLYRTLTRAPPLSAYASADARAANEAVVPASGFRVRFIQEDLLSARGMLSHQDLGKLLSNAALVTLMFTLNELYSTSLSQTQGLLQHLTSIVRTGALLLVVDSPGSYSTVAINGKEKRYPMAWLLDYTLLRSNTPSPGTSGKAGKPGQAVATNGQDENASARQEDGRERPEDEEGDRKGGSEGGGRQWEKLVSDDSRWFRLPKDLKSPIELENMRYQIHLYRRL